MKAAKVLHLKKAQSHSNKAMRLSGERDGIKHPDNAATPENLAMGTEPEPLTWLDKRGRVIELDSTPSNRQGNKRPVVE